MSSRPLIAVALLAAALVTDLQAQQITGQDVDAILQKADKLFEEAKAAYEDARSKASVAAFVDAGFKLEEARIKYIVIQEVGSPEKQKTASDRLRAVNQLSKLIHDGKVAITGSPAESPVPKSPDPAPPAPGVAPPADPPPSKPPVDVSKRAPVPDAAKQKEAEKIIKDVFKDQYAKKAPADRASLARTLLGQAARTADDPPAVWVLYREAQEIAVQLGDVSTALRTIDETAKMFDVDAASLKTTAIAALGKTAKAPGDFAALAEALNALIDDLVATDQYDAADKAAASALQYSRRSNDVSLASRATARAKEVSEAKARFVAMKAVLETLAKNPEDAAANNEMGQFLCFVKANWDLGLRFMVKGSDVVLRSLAEKELAVPSQSAEIVALADGWWDLAEKERSPLRKSQMLAHAKVLYEAGASGTAGIARAKVEKRLDILDGASGGPVNLLRMIDPKVDAVKGDWKFENAFLTCAPEGLGRLQIPYQPPEEYDVTMVVSRRSGTDAVIFGLVAGGTQFLVAIDGFSGQGGMTYAENFDGGGQLEKNPTAVRGLQITGSQPYTLVYSVRKKGFSLTINGKKVIAWEGEWRHFTQNPDWRVPDARALYVGNYTVAMQISRLTLNPVSGQGKKLR